jgi:D-alanine-D-alanine ligase-like ATP-grasp enzyme
MRNLREFRAGKPGFYPDQSVYAAYACAEFGLAFADLDSGTGLVISVASQARTIHFAAGRCSWYPQNSATASTLASDKYFTNIVLERAGIPTLGGQYFFLHDRHRAHRPRGHEGEDARNHFRQLGAAAFVKPLTGSRGDFAQIVRGEAALDRYCSEVSRYYDAILMQPVFTGHECRIFLLDDEVVYCAQKSPPSLLGDGFSSIRDLLVAHNEALRCRGLSPVSVTDAAAALDTILPAGERWDIPGRMNWSAGGAVTLDAPRSEQALALARKALHALGLRVAAVDLFTDIEADAEAMRVIEVNSNPSIRLLEQHDRGDLILKIWHHTFLSLGLLAR